MLNGVSDDFVTTTFVLQAVNNSSTTTVITFTFPAFRKNCNVLDIIKISLVSVVRCQ